MMNSQFGAGIGGSATVHSMHNSTTNNFFPLTPWCDASQIKKVRFMMEVRGVTHASNFKIKACYQAANYPEDANPVTNALDDANGYLVGNGFKYATTWDDISATLEDYQIVRFGVLVSQQTTSEGVHSGWASLKVDTQGP